MKDCFDELRAQLPNKLVGRLIGAGIVASDEFERATSADEGLTKLNEYEQLLHEHSGLEIYLQNDCTAAAGAQVIFGGIEELEDFVYIFIGRTIGLRLVLNHRVYAGGALATHRPMPGLIRLEEILSSEGKTSRFLWDPSQSWPDHSHERNWIAETSGDIASLVSTICGFVSLQNVLIEGNMPGRVLDDIVKQAEHELAGLVIKKDDSFTIRSGNIGPFSQGHRCCEHSIVCPLHG